MVTAVTSGIRISVTPRYEPDYREPGSWNYFFSYEVCIENLNDFHVQLIGREWHIFDTVGEKRLVQGMGVVGESPVIAPGERYIYHSACDLKGDFGYMTGYYQMLDYSSKQMFKVRIPRFNLEVPYAMN